MKIRNLLLLVVAVPFMFACEENKDVSNPTPEIPVVTEQYRIKKVTWEYLEPNQWGIYDIRTIICSYEGNTLVQIDEGQYTYPISYNGDTVFARIKGYNSQGMDYGFGAIGTVHKYVSFISQNKLLSKEFFVDGELFSKEVFNYKGDVIGEKINLLYSDIFGSIPDSDTSSITSYSYQGGELIDYVTLTSQTSGKLKESYKSTYTRENNILTIIDSISFNPNLQGLSVATKKVIEYAGDKAVSMEEIDMIQQTIPGYESFITSFSYAYSDTGYVEERVNSVKKVIIEYEKGEGNEELFINLSLY